VLSAPWISSCLALSVLGAKRAGKDPFLRTVRSAVIQRLIEKGILHGKREEVRDMADGSVFNRE